MTKIQTWTINADTFIRPIVRFGFDPGTTHFGAAIHVEDSILLFQVDLVRDPNPLQRMADFECLLNYVCGLFIASADRVEAVVIEGAGYEASHYRQVELAECRTAVALWFKSLGVPGERITLMNPKTIRKRAFGSGNVVAHKYWDEPEIGKDALAALSCLYAIESEEI